MRAVVFEQFGVRPEVREVDDPAPAPDGVVVRVGATGLCRSDWHGWQGHDPDIRLPHVPGHEFAGVVVAAGADVRGWRPGDRVTAPFVCACGRCPSCLAGDQQVCERQTQPGFTGWGSFADLVAVRHADVNLVRLPDELDEAAAAALGCRFATAFRAVVAQGRVAAGEWVAVHGCGGVGLSVVMVAAASGARVVAVDVSSGALELARRSGAAVCVDASALDGPAEVAAAIREATGGGAHLSLDALGSHATCVASIEGLRRRGRHVQVGLLPAAQGRPALPMDLVIAYELELRGSHGMPAHAYPEMLRLVTAGVLRPAELVTRTIDLDAAPDALATMDRPATAGMCLIRP
ncbi:zinc-dependent alcohol dehydrogenase family protein [Micromonospora aurantiaca]|uniref:zinc-dependent alcohol dehydrogenase family protein n=2 Tax=Micromonospora aurantiaca (nom. illeg.) TaxID=47850 RepID=UPI000F3CBB9E|nr:zinc-dependent alcohol dehydrogenase family protein [Micromonospora aurantiaca]RNI06238.1 alcohol dehydrogenase [Micromonospora aurantiaca]UFN96407.1 zinc-dependent alcohol dehydrogenase family protein [Micromonospora aurantiaca]